MGTNEPDPDFSSRFFSIEIEHDDQSFTLDKIKEKAA